MSTIKRIISIFLLTILIASPTFAFCSKKNAPKISNNKLNYININWWANFSDPCLQHYIKQAVENNHDAKAASWKVEEYKQMVKIQFAQELPSLSVGGNYLGLHTPDTIKGLKSNLFIVPFIASYEADVFLKNKDKTKSSKKAYEASEFQEQSIYISLASDVAATYINILKFDKQIQIQKEIVEAKLELLRREESKYKRGVTSIPQVNKIKNDYNSSKNSLDELTKSRDKALNQLSLLIGESSQTSADLKRGTFDSLKYTTEIPKEIPSEVLFSRPDIKAAEANLAKANIDVRVARKEFLPKINIYGLYSFSNIGSGFGSWESTLAAILANASIDLFRGGAKVANLKLNKAKYEEMFEHYKQTDLNAVREVNDSLILIKEDKDINDNTEKTLKSTQDNYQRAMESYKNGTISYTTLLNERTNYLQATQNKTVSQTNCLINYITLYKTVGGKL